MSIIGINRDKANPHIETPTHYQLSLFSPITAIYDSLLVDKYGLCPVPHNSDYFYRPEKDRFENSVEKGENAGN